MTRPARLDRGLCPSPTWGANSGTRREVVAYPSAVANPAELLLARLESWNTQDTRQPPGDRRQFGSDRTAALRLHEIALSYITAIRELLDTAERSQLFPVGDYRAELLAWTEMVLAYPAGWFSERDAQPSNYGAFDPHSLRLLRTLGPQLRPLLPAWTEEQRNGFADGVAELVETLRDDPTIKGELANYLLNLVLHIRHVLAEYDLRGDFDLTRAVFLLKASVDTAADSSTDDESKPRWQRLRRLFSITAATGKAAIETKDIWGPLMLPPRGLSRTRKQRAEARRERSCAAQFDDLGRSLGERVALR